MIDIFIILLGFVTFIFFFVLQLLFLRLFPSFERVGFLMRLQLLLGVLAGGSVVLIYVLRVITLESFFMTLVFSQILFHGLVIIYLRSIFSYIESSITIKLLYLISNTTAGMNRKEIKYRYSKRDVLNRRLDRFLFMKVLIKNGFVYEKKKRVSVFDVREKIVNFMDRCFPKPD